LNTWLARHKLQVWRRLDVLSHYMKTGWGADREGISRCAMLLELESGFCPQLGKPVGKNHAAK